MNTNWDATCIERMASFIRPRFLNYVCQSLKLLYSEKHLFLENSLLETAELIDNK